ncbi:MAG: diacylglycerol/lipid kinase family protein, partial [bacterium]
MRRALTVVNPIAGRGRGRAMAVRLAEALSQRGMELELAATSQAGDGRSAAGRAGDYDLLVAVGGDGTLNEVVNGLEADCPVALFPLGTGNVLAKELRLPRRVDRFCEMVAQG